MICIRCGKNVILEGVECPECGGNNAVDIIEKEVKVEKKKRGK